jgi:sigma-B regulation protein RsbU (phosphoserine phosphatase)
MKLAAHYQTSRRAGGDYYDFFPLPDDRWGILIADVSGHGTPAAVVMAITHSIAHTYPGPPAPPCEMLDYVNRKLTTHYTNGSGTFVTAFYGVYDPKTRELQYSCAGHPPPRVKSCQGNRIYSMDCDPNLPLGISADQCYPGKAHTLRPGDQLVFYTDGITEAFNHEGDQFGVERLDAALNRCENEAPELIDAVLCDLDRFTNGAPAGDDRTLVLAKIS